MGRKHKHSQDKLHKTVSELASHHVVNRDLELSTLHRRLRYDHCCLSLDVITDKFVGLCDDSGYCYVFGCDLLTKFIEKYHVHPITGKGISADQIFELKFHKSNDGQYHCPVIYKLFNQHSKIVANKRSGHVYSYEAYHRLNLKQNNLRDLLTNEVFTKDDIVIIQDPDLASTKWAVSEFFYVKEKLKISDDSVETRIRNLDQSEILKSSLEEYKGKADIVINEFNRILGQEIHEGQSKDIVKLDKFNSAVESDGVLSRSVTSTVMPVASRQNPTLLNHDQIVYPRIKKKGYVRLITNHGPLNLELYCDRTPKTCHNFLLLASRGYYDNTKFHRLIKNFIIQGGDPTGTGSGGQSAWGEPFKDECHNDLKHVGRGVLAMANSGPNTNKSQFYITLKGTWDHLDSKHTVFGRVVGGDETLSRIEAIEVDKKDCPKEEVKIIQIIKYVDPFEEIETSIENERKKESQKLPDGTASAQPLKKFRSGVGAYINLDALKKDSSDGTKSNGATEPKTSDLSTQLASIGCGIKKRKLERD